MFGYFVNIGKVVCLEKERQKSRLVLDEFIENLIPTKYGKFRRNHRSENQKKYPANAISKTFSYGIIYIYSIPDENHKGRLKIGSATASSINPKQEDIKLAAHKRIKQQTKTADIPYKLEYAELAITNKEEYFSDHDVHEVLKRSGYKRKSENVRNQHSEWFEVSLEIAKKAIQAVKEGRPALTTRERIPSQSSEFPFRPNQREAIDQTTKAIKKKRNYSAILKKQL